MLLAEEAFCVQLPVADVGSDLQPMVAGLWLTCYRRLQIQGGNSGRRPILMSGLVIEREILIEAPVEVVWRTITEPDQVSQWFADRVDLVFEPR